MIGDSRYAISSRQLWRSSVRALAVPVVLLAACSGSSWLARANRPPVADAGPDMIVFQGRAVRLDGSASTDPDGPIASYRWVQTAGKPVRRMDSTSASPEILLPYVDPSGENLQFTLTVTDAAGSTATDTVTLRVVKYLFHEEFRYNTTKRYAPRNVGSAKSAGEFRYVAALENVHVIPGQGAGLAFSHDVPGCDYGTFSFVFSGTRFRRRGGIIRVRLMEDNETYYEMFSGSNGGNGGLRKVVQGREVDVARFDKWYSPNVSYPVKIVFRPGEAFVDAFNDISLMNGDWAPITVRRFEIFTEGQETYFDNLTLVQDPFLKLRIPHRLGLWDSTLFVKAIPGNMPDGASIRFLLDADDKSSSIVEDHDAPYEVLFHNVSLSVHIVGAYLPQD